MARRAGASRIQSLSPFLLLIRAAESQASQATKLRLRPTETLPKLLLYDSNDKADPGYTLENNEFILEDTTAAGSDLSKAKYVLLPPIAQLANAPAGELRLLHLAVVLVVVDFLRQLVLLLMERVLVSRAQVAAVCGAHLLLFFGQVRFLVFQFAGFIGSQPPVLDAIRDAALLV
jgi:hypothetical protein